jgi:hypothetical protein
MFTVSYWEDRRMTASTNKALLAKLAYLALGAALTTALVAGLLRATAHLDRDVHTVLEADTGAPREPLHAPAEPIAGR